MGMMTRENLGLEYWFPLLGTYPLKDEVGMGVVCITFKMSLRKGRYAEYLQWDSMSKFQKGSDNLYEVWVLVMGDTNYYRSGETFTKTACPTRGLWFVYLMRYSKLWMEVIKKQDFGVFSDVIYLFLEG